MSRYDRLEPVFVNEVKKKVLVTGQLRTSDKMLESEACLMDEVKRLVKEKYKCEDFDVFGVWAVDNLMRVVLWVNKDQLDKFFTRCGIRGIFMN